MTAPRFRKCPEGGNYYLDRDPPPTQMEVLVALREDADALVGAAMQSDIVEHIARRMRSRIENAMLELEES